MLFQGKICAVYSGKEVREMPTSLHLSILEALLDRWRKLCLDLLSANAVAVIAASNSFFVRFRLHAQLRSACRFKISHVHFSIKKMPRVHIWQQKRSEEAIRADKQGRLEGWVKRARVEKHVAEEDHLVDHFIDPENPEEKEADADRIELAKKKWQPSWKDKWDWLEFDEKIGRVFCSICRADAGNNSTFGKDGSMNLRTSAFIAHAKSSDHKNSSFVAAGGRQSLQIVREKTLARLDKGLVVLFRTTYYIAKGLAPFRRFPEVIQLQRLNGLHVLKQYNSNKACRRFIKYISQAIEEVVVAKVKASPFFGIMIDESTDLSSTKHLIIYASYVEHHKAGVTNLGLVPIVEGGAATIQSVLVDKLISLGLDLKKWMAFGSDGASVMVGCRSGVASRLKEVNPFITSIHRLAHRTQLAIEDASNSSECKQISKALDDIVNKVASYFSKSPKRQDALKQVQEELDYGILKVLKYQEIRWLSRYGAVTALCTNLEPVLHVLQQGQPDLFEMLRSFKIIYLIHFLGDILEHLKKLSLEFQKSTIDITLVGGLARAAISDIKVDYLEQKVDLNGNLTDSRGYPIIPDHGFFGGPLSALRAAVKGKEYRGIEMVRDFDGLDLAEALNFQRSFSLAMVAALENRIEDGSKLSKQMKILVPRYLPERGRDLKKYGEDIAKEIAEQYGNEKINLDGVLFDPIIHKEEFLREYRKWKNQGITEWEGMNFMKCWGNILAAPQWAAKYPQLLQIALIGMVQCCSTAECERGFSQLNIMKIKFRNGLKTETINALLLICLAGPSLESYDFSRSIQLWKDDANYRHMFTSGIAGDMLSDNEEASKGEDKEEEG